MKDCLKPCWYGSDGGLCCGDTIGVGCWQRLANWGILYGLSCWNGASSGPFGRWLRTELTAFGSRPSFTETPILAGFGFFTSISL